eukprot:4812129-Ditylum_brightwellii.AAC.1
MKSNTSTDDDETQQQQQQQQRQSQQRQQQQQRRKRRRKKQPQITPASLGISDAGDSSTASTRNTNDKDPNFATLDEALVPDGDNNIEEEEDIHTSTTSTLGERQQPSSASLLPQRQYH